MQRNERITSEMFDRFEKEYNSRDAVLKYSKHTAGHGINYLLSNDYADIYMKVIHADGFLNQGTGLRLLEFGCGVGMNLITLIGLLKKQGIRIEKAVGTDFSPTLIASAKDEAKEFLDPEELQQTRFFVAANENLLSGIAASAGESVAELTNSFDLLIGVNTFRYCHRLGKTTECTDDIFSLLRKGGVCVMIDMNRGFPLFRSKLKKSVEDPIESYLPTLDEYAEPFLKSGFEILEKTNFCWVPHSAGPLLVNLCRTLTPILNLTVRKFAMRSLVIARKPA